MNHVLACAALAFTIACGGMFSQSRHQWGADERPPPPITTGEAAEAFAAIAKAEPQFLSWRVNAHNGPDPDNDVVIPEGARFVGAYPVYGAWQLERDETDRVVGRFSYMAVLYREHDGCVWVRGRFSQAHLGAGQFAPSIELVLFSWLQKDDVLTGTLVEEKRHRYRCDA